MKKQVNEAWRSSDKSGDGGGDGAGGGGWSDKKRSEAKRVKDNYVTGLAHSTYKEAPNGKVMKRYQRHDGGWNDKGEEEEEEEEWMLGDESMELRIGDMMLGDQPKGDDMKETMLGDQPIDDAMKEVMVGDQPIEAGYRENGPAYLPPMPQDSFSWVS